MNELTREERLDLAQWLGAFAKQFASTTRDTLERAADTIEPEPEAAPQTHRIERVIRRARMFVHDPPSAAEPTGPNMALRSAADELERLYAAVRQLSPESWRAVGWRYEQIVRETRHEDEEGARLAGCIGRNACDAIADALDGKEAADE